MGSSLEGNSMKKLLTLLFLFIPMLLFAQYEVSFFDDADEVILIINGFEEPVDFGVDLLSGDAVRTENSTVELLNPNGRVLVDRFTSFRINDVCIENSNITVNGRIRVILDRITGEFEFLTQTSVVGVRGTDFILEADGEQDRVYVQEGVVEVEHNGEAVIVGEGEMIDTGNMTPREMTVGERLKFEQLTFNSVQTGKASLKTFSVAIEENINLSLINLERQVNDFTTDDMEIIDTEIIQVGENLILQLWYRID